MAVSSLDTAAHRIGTASIDGHSYHRFNLPIFTTLGLTGIALAIISVIKLARAAKYNRNNNDNDKEQHNCAKTIFVAHIKRIIDRLKRVVNHQRCGIRIDLPDEAAHPG